MEAITIGEIAAAVTLLAGLITGITVITKQATKSLDHWHHQAMNPILTKLDAIERRVETVELENCKNYIVNFLSKVEAGDRMTNDSVRRFYENYKRYRELGGNTYIKKWVERLEESGKLSLPHVA